MKKPMILSIMAMVVAALLFCGGTYSYFCDSAFSGGNWFRSGRIDLKIRDQNEPFSKSVSATWVKSNIKPGDEMTFNTINDAPFVDLRNFGTVPGCKLDIHVANSVQGSGGPTADDMDKYMQITRMEYSDSFPQVMNLLNNISDVNGNDFQGLTIIADFTFTLRQH